jgi:hypothetical protein
MRLGTEGGARNVDGAEPAVGVKEPVVLWFFNAVKEISNDVPGVVDVICMSEPRAGY